ncbi:hypothetical protein [Streptomyces griseoaurantiacus]|uniref:hypothetical protein n=1 Tax=Streptomyces griseoaurantiacus TaxID=68213 RepID=UPI0036BEEE6D
MTSWTVYVEADMEVSEEEAARIGELLAARAPGAVMAPAPVLGCRFAIDEVLPTRALTAAEGLFLPTVRKALRARRFAEDREVEIVRVELSCEAEAGWTPRGLITHTGLAARLGISRQRVNHLMRYKGAPNPVDVEGGDRAAIYDREVALAYLREVTGRAG